MLQSRVNQHNPTTSRAFRYSGRISSTPGALPPRNFLITSVTSAPEVGEPAPRSPGSNSSVEDVPVGLRRSSKYSAHRPTTSQVVLYPTPKTPDCGPYSPRSRMEVVFHGLSELLNHLLQVLPESHRPKIPGFGLPGLTGILPHHRSQVSNTCGRRSDDTTTKSFIELRPRVSWCPELMWFFFSIY
ncbi:hypothetical protein AMECASPLE_021912 [Ameca splendens]|uniref:Uncharacterized protein n=1 Tax=Ameca splendens TaxID=208324 RepID=A0ABV0YQJ3_9TELE